ncbi:MAG: ADP-ribosylation factor-like protein [Candidatus Hodarchaeota archaeon]
MSKKFSDKLNLISKFLNPEVVKPSSLKKIKDILNLSVLGFKFLDKTDAKTIQEWFEVDTIGEITTIDMDEPFKKVFKNKATKIKMEQLLEKNPEFEEKLRKAITISHIIHRMKKEVVEIKKKDQKIIVIGLSNAGKTAILSKFGGKLGIKELTRLEPTRGVSHQTISTEDLNLAIWDFGGQVDYRNKYLRQPEKYFLGVDLVIYVIDVQDSNRYYEAIDYFDSLITVISRLELQPFFLIFIHKLDPDLRDDPEVQLNIELLQDLIKSIFEGKNLDYEIYLSSIYSMISKEPKFAKFLKEFMKDEAFIEASEGDKIDQLSEIVEKAMTMMIQLSESTMKQFSELESRITAIETGKKTSTRQFIQESQMTPSPIYASTPLPPPPSNLKAPKTQSPSQVVGMSVRAAIVSELRELFSKRSELVK